MSRADPIHRLNAALEGRYRIERELGEGGMATVYLADDLKHERKVALKVLKPELAAAVGAERFLAEIKTTANLQHPHILALHDSGEADGLLFYVMPYVRGESLRERIEREHQLPVDESVRIATALAEALDYAHRQGVIHRDIKPANVLLQEGTPVISDFGIALAVGAAGGGRLTETGLSLGTPHYMSPEQATGDRNVGPPTDIYALGCVLYEMLVGEPPFTGSTPQAVLGRIITGERPSLRSARGTVPLNVDAAIGKALEKVPADRFRAGADFAAALADESFQHGGATATRSASARGWQALSAATTLAALVLAALLLRPAPDDEPQPEPWVLAPLAVPDQLTPRGIVDLSADGTVLAYETYEGPEDDISIVVWHRDQLYPALLPGAEGGREPAISRAGDQLAYVQGEEIRVTSVDGGPPRTLLEAEGACCLRWGPDDGFLYFTEATGALVRLAVDGGDPNVEPVVTPAQAEAEVVGWAAPLPGGAGVLFQASDVLDFDSRVMILDHTSGEVRELAPGRYPRYARGLVVYARQPGDALVARPFDPATLEALGEARSVAQEVAYGGGAEPYRLNPVSFGMSQDGTLVYNAGPREAIRRTPVWVSRDGSWTLVDSTWVGPLYGLRLSPDETRLASSSDAVNGIMVKDLAGGPITSLVLPGASLVYRPSWSPDGDSLIFTSNAGGAPTDIQAFIGPADGSSAPEPLGVRQPHSFLTPDAEWVVYRTPMFEGADVFAVPRDGGEPVPVVTSGGTELQPTLSKDGRYLAYTSDASGRYEVYVRPFPNAEAWRLQISVAGGHSPVWARDGSELFYRTSAHELAAARLQDGPRLSVVSRTVLFDASDFGASDLTSTHYDVTADGQRFIMLRTLGGGLRSGPRQLVVLDDVPKLMRSN